MTVFATSEKDRRRFRAVLHRTTAIVSGAFLAVGGVSFTAQLVNAVPGTPGISSAPTVLYDENFENGAGVQTLQGYTGAGGENYTADPYWLNTQNCNGTILRYTDAPPPGYCLNFGGGSEWSSVQAKTYALGLLNNPADPTTNRALSTNTAPRTPGETITPNQIEFETAQQLNLPASGRFLTFSVDAAANACWGDAPLLRFYFKDNGGVETPVSSSAINPCTDPRGLTTTVDGPPVSYGTFAANGSVLVSGNSVGIVLRNESNGAGAGNDGAIDNVRVLDVTPQLDKSFSPTLVKTGDTSTLTFTVTNTAELAAKRGWSFTDSLPAGLTVASPSAAATTCPAGAVTAASGSAEVAVSGDLDAGMTSCTISMNVTSATAGTFTNGPGNVTETGLNPPGNAIVSFQDPQLTLAKHAADPVDTNGNGITDTGDTIEYTFTVTNSGDVPLTGIGVTDAKAGAVDCPQPNLAPGDSETCTAVTPYTVTDADLTAGAVDNTATATGTPPNTTTQISSPPSTTHSPTTAPAPSLSIVKSASPTTGHSAGQLITYSFQVTNTGNVPLNGVKVDDSDFSGTGALSAVDCPAAIRPLEPREEMTCTATYNLTQADVDAGHIDNTATASGTPTGSTTVVPSQPSTSTVTVEQEPALTLVKSASPSAPTDIRAGETITYSFVVANTGNVTLTDVAVKEGDFTGSGTLAPPSCPPAEAASLAPGTQMTCTASYSVTQADVDAGKITNTATAEGTPPRTPRVVSQPSSATVPASANPATTLVKSSDTQKITATGQIVHYSFTVTNTGNVTLTEPKINEDQFTGAGKVSTPICPTETAGLLPGQKIVCTATYTVTAGDLTGKPLENTATVTVTTPSGDPVTSDPSTARITDVVDSTPKPASTETSLASTGSTIGWGVVSTATALLVAGGTLLFLRRRSAEYPVN